MQTLILNTRYKKTLKDLFEQYIPHHQVWAFGSRIQGKSHEGSDLDLIVINLQNPDQITKNLLTLSAAIKESELPILIDLLDWALIPDDFQTEIRENHLVFFP